jgi:hypothetical protein
MTRYHRLVAALSLTILSLPPPPTQAVGAYWWYENATCLNEHTIKGISHLSFDDPDYSSWDTTDTKYYGGCFYFLYGYVDLDNWDFSNIYNYGECVTCYNIVGCSSDGTCGNFMTYAPSTTSFSSSSSSSSSLSSKSASLSSSSTYELSNQALGMKANTPRLASAASKLQQKTLQASYHRSKSFIGYNTGNEQDPNLFKSDATSLVIVAVVTLLGTLGLIIRFRNFWRAKRPAVIIQEDDDGELHPPGQEYYYMNHGEPRQQYDQQQSVPPRQYNNANGPNPFTHDQFHTGASERIIL